MDIRKKLRTCTSGGAKHSNTQALVLLLLFMWLEWWLKSSTLRMTEHKLPIQIHPTEKLYEPGLRIALGLCILLMYKYYLTTTILVSLPFGSHFENS